MRLMVLSSIAHSKLARVTLLSGRGQRKCGVRAEGPYSYDASRCLVDSEAAANLAGGKAGRQHTQGLNLQLV